MEKGTKYLLALNAHPKIGSQTLKKALVPFANPEELWLASQSDLAKKLDPKIAGLIFEAREKYSPEEEIAKLQKFDIGYVTYYDREYPPLLKELPDCPMILYVRGEIKALSKKGIGVVGSRKYSNYGKIVASTLSAECTAGGLSIISGLALGIDAFAHEAALQVGGTTVGVLGCGLDKIYPISNYQLGRRVIESSGAIISEFPLGTPPMKQNFPARNRIIAGLSLGVLVIEAAIQSGALITAYQALEYNREVFAIPGNITSESSAGTNKLLKEGARLVTSASDIFENLMLQQKTAREKAREILPATEEEGRIVQVLQKEELSVDDIIKQTGYNVIIVSTTLTMMEMKGFVKNLGGGRYGLIGQ
jgi:DNA processing protein